MPWRVAEGGREGARTGETWETEPRRKRRAWVNRRLASYKVYSGNIYQERSGEGKEGGRSDSVEETAASVCKKSQNSRSVNWNS